MRVQDIFALAETLETKLAAAAATLQFEPVLVVAPPLPPPPLPLDACPSTPLPDCEAPAKSQLFMKAGDDGGGDRLKFDFTQGVTPQVWDDLADPTAQTSCLLCLYVASSLATSVEVPPGSPTWRARPRGKGYQYRDPDGTAAGVVKATLDAGGRGTPELPNVTLLGKGRNLPDQPLPVAAPIDVAVQVVNASNHNCWGDIYTNAIVNSRGEPSTLQGEKAVGRPLPVFAPKRPVHLDKRASPYLSSALVCTCGPVLDPCCREDECNGFYAPKAGAALERAAPQGKDRTGRSRRDRRTPPADPLP